jgi:chromosome partitioning protein
MNTIPQTRVIALANQKGGVGKTTSTLNLGAALASRGRRVLLIDLDPQSNLTMGLGVNPYEERHTAYHVLHNAAEQSAAFAVMHVHECLDLIPATLDMAAAEIELAGAISRESLLRRALSEIKGDYNYILIDPPPSLGLFTLNALAAATEVLIPLQPQPYAMKGMGQLQKTIKHMRQVNGSLRIGGVLLTMVQHNNLNAALIDKIRASPLAALVYQTTIPQNVRLAESSASGKPIIEYDASSTGAAAYAALAEEIDHGAA